MKTERMIEEFTLEGNNKLGGQYTGTREAIFQIAVEKMQEYMRDGDIGLGEEERELLVLIIARSMMQSFSLGYGIGKAEGVTRQQIYL